MRPLGRDPSEPVRGRIGAAVVDGDDLELLAWQREAENLGNTES
jgi:hypothetical protein